MAGCRTYKYLLKPTTKQVATLERLVAGQRELYNAALEERRGAWRMEHRSVTYFDQSRTLTELRSVRPDILAFGVTVARGTLTRLDRSFSAFYRRCRKGEAPGFPRFKGAGSFDSVQWEDTNGWNLDEATGRLKLLGVGNIKVKLHRPTKGVPKAITVKKSGPRWWLSVRCVEVPAEPLPATGRSVGVDLGVGVLVATSDGELFCGPRFAKRSEAELARAQQALATKTRGSKRRQKAKERVATVHRKIADQRRDAHHKLSRRLVDRYDVIVFEDLKITNMTRRPQPRPDGKGGHEPNGAGAKAGLNRSIQDAGWGTLQAMVAYKAESAGRQVIVVDPRNSSRRCAHCGHTEKENRHKAAFKCLVCGHEAHADVNAACNILRAGRAQQLLHLAA
jgi:putative transposase